jgi:hypothetical protein
MKCASYAYVNTKWQRKEVRKWAQEKGNIYQKKRRKKTETRRCNIKRIYINLDPLKSVGTPEILVAYSHFCVHALIVPLFDSFLAFYVSKALIFVQSYLWLLNMKL